ncbi:MAG: septal ring lytic transglycosylase RlpA family protein [Luteitalea sp.]|nr:septal ring lytic transglycosylase RlpA family protein [Luteitalea sp.]
MRSSPFIAVRSVVIVILVAAACVLAACATRTAKVGPAGPAVERQSGIASFYAKDFHGRTTASGARFNMHAMTAAHPAYAFGTKLRVTNLTNGRSTVVTVNDRGPAAWTRSRGVIIDLSYGAAKKLGFVRKGLQRVALEVISWGDGGRRQ